MAVMRRSFNGSAAVWPVAVALSAPAVLLPASPAQALSFRFDFGRGVSDEFQMAAEEAADAWSYALKDDAVVDLRLEFTDLSKLGGDVLGGAQTGKVKVKYSDYANALLRDAVSTDDFSGLSSLQLSSKGRSLLQDFQSGRIDRSKVNLDSKEFSFLLDGQFGQGKSQSNFINDSGADNNKNIVLTRAQAKALNLVDINKKGLDAIIKINDQVQWDFNQRDGISSDRYDAVSVLQHEIGHALGIVSGVDNLDFLAATNAPVEDLEKGKFSYLTPMDFYRYSDESADLGVMDLTLGGEKYFSLDGGQSAVTDEFGRQAYFSTGSLSSGGDGYQGSHWKETGGRALGVMNPSLLKGETNQISQLDLTLLDVVGWDLEDSLEGRAAALGLDWQRLTAEFASDRQAVVDRAVYRWGGQIPALDAAIDNAAADVDLDFQEKLKEKFYEMERKLKEKPKDRNKAFSKFYEEVRKEADKRNKEIGDLPEDIYKMDKEIRDWLSESPDKLAEKVEKASVEEMNRLANLVKNESGSDRAQLETKLEVAFSQISNKPSKLVEELLKNSGPANPIGYGFRRRWWFWLQVSGESAEDFEDYSDSYEDAYESSYDFLRAGAELEIDAVGIPSSGSTAVLDSGSSVPVPTMPGLRPMNTAAMDLVAFDSAQRTAAEKAKDIPEPSSVLALFGIAALGAGLKRRRA